MTPVMPWKRATSKSALRGPSKSTTRQRLLSPASQATTLALAGQGSGAAMRLH
jgi:hypothetical protein